MWYYILASILEVNTRVGIFVGVPDVVQGSWAVVLND
jgi:hypothetical protein